jgi:2-polyprenyl-6-methoxyphenol hydroxylase-like FAD-dependent oxidoreductase
MSELPSSAKIVIIGGGIVGCSVAYHLGRMGLTDVLLIGLKKVADVVGLPPRVEVFVPGGLSPEQTD